jgi:ubiquitin carboxyl-terminal hydrolase 10
MFMREFNVIDSAVSMDQLRMRLKANELEQYSESFTPDFVYDVINKLPKFSSLRVSPSISHPLRSAAFSNRK